MVVTISAVLMFGLVAVAAVAVAVLQAMQVVAETLVRQVMQAHLEIVVVLV